MQGMWKYEHRISGSSPWTPIYHFGLTRFTAKDFDIMNIAVSSQRTSFFTRTSESYSMPLVNDSDFLSKVICTKTLFDKGKDNIIGLLILADGSLKKRVHGISEIIVECKHEAERVEVLKAHFGIILSRREQSGIKGTTTDLG